MFPLSFKRNHPHVGARPGTLIIDSDAPLPKIRVIHFNQDKVSEEELTDIEQLRTAHSGETVTWVDVQGFGDEQLIRQISETFSLHPLAIEDIVNVPQRPKAEEYGDQLLILVRMVQPGGHHAYGIEQVSIVLGENYVLTFQERHGDILEPVRKRIQSGKGLIRKEGPGYLAYAIFDTIVDAYYPLLEQVSEEMAFLDDQVLTNPAPEILNQLHRTKNHLTNLHRCVGPQREVANQLVRGDSPLIDSQVQLYLRDTLDHCIQTAEVVEMYREMTLSLMHTYLSVVSNRTNEIMRVLTIVGTIFIPLTFITGVYGMNFRDMPELHFKWSYPVFWLVMLALSCTMVLFFARKGWLGPRSQD